jgi:ubiquinone/menaquinone biosynthesis C-methylase UbiE
MKDTYWETFDGLYQMGDQKHRLYILDRLQKMEVNSILDVGCGTGPIGEMIVRHGYYFKYKGVDYSESMIKVAKEYFPHLEWEVQDMRDLKEPDNSWDCVLLMHSLDHTNDYQASIKEAARVSNKYVFIELWRALKEEGTNLNSVNRMGKKDDEQPFEDTHLQEYSLESLTTEFEKNNLKILEIVDDDRVNDNGNNTLFILEKCQ